MYRLGDIRQREKGSLLSGHHGLPGLVRMLESGRSQPEARTPDAAPISALPLAGRKAKGYHRRRGAAASLSRGSPHGHSGVATGFGPWIEGLQIAGGGRPIRTHRSRGRRPALSVCCRFSVHADLSAVRDQQSRHELTRKLGRVTRDRWEPWRPTLGDLGCSRGPLRSFSRCPRASIVNRHAIGT
jgi:hypothetical protein